MLSHIFFKGKMRLSFVPLSLYPKPLAGTGMMSSSHIFSPQPLALGLPSATHLPFPSQALKLHPHLWRCGLSEGWRKSAFHQPRSSLPPGRQVPSLAASVSPPGEEGVGLDLSPGHTLALAELFPSTLAWVPLSKILFNWTAVRPRSGCF